MSYPTVKWLNEAKALLNVRVAGLASFTSLDFKQDLRNVFPSYDVRQAQVGQFLRCAFKERLMPNFDSVVEGNHLRYVPRLTRWQKLMRAFGFI